MANTPVHTFRLAAGLWTRFVASAKARGMTASDLIRQLVEEHLERDDPDA